MIEIPKWMYDLDPEQLPEVYRKYVDILGFKPMLALIANYSGEYCYVPKLDALIKLTRDDKLMADYVAGLEPAQLAHKYNLSVVHVYEIIKREKRERAKTGDQLSLLDDCVGSP